MHPEQQRAIDYLARKGTNADVATLRSQLRHAFRTAEEAFDEVGADERGRRPAPDKWSPHEILDHLVLSHGPAIAQFATLLDGADAEGVAIPADLHRDERPPWDELRAQLGDIHRQFLRLIDAATGEHSLEAKAMIEMVVKIDGKPVRWHERLDWKAFIQGVRVHTLEHCHQLERVFRNDESAPGRRDFRTSVPRYLGTSGSSEGTPLPPPSRGTEEPLLGAPLAMSGGSSITTTPRQEE